MLKSILRKRCGMLRLRGFFSFSRSSLSSATGLAMSSIKDYANIQPKKIERPVYSFAAGPAALPYPVMKNVQKHFINYRSKHPLTTHILTPSS